MNRTHCALCATLVLAVACGKPSAPPPPAPVAAAPTDPVAEAAASYRIVAAITPAPIARGARTMLAIDIDVTNPFVHVQAEFPLKVTLTPSAGLTLAKRTLGHADSKDPKAKGRRWEVAVTPKKVGRQEVEAVMRFALCKEREPQWCVTRNETVRAAVQVR